MHRRSRWLIRILPALLPAAVLGCGPERPAEKISYYRASDRRFHKIHRIVLVELGGAEATPAVAKDMTQLLSRAMQGRQIFHVDTLRRSDPTCRDLALDSASYTLTELLALRKALGCDAVLLGHINHFRPYPRMQVGVFLKLLDLRNGDLIWGVDHTWDSTERTTELQLKYFFENEMRSGYEPVDWQLGLVSPRAFLKFVAHRIANTLPSRQPIQATKGRGTGGSAARIRRFVKNPWRI